MRRSTGTFRVSDPNGRSTEYTLIVFGASRVGKTALVGQFLWDGFITEYRPTVEEFNWIEYTGEDENAILLQVIDTSGSHDFLAMRHLYARTGDAFIVVFAVDDLASLDEAKVIIDEIHDRNTKKAPILLVANKIDLLDDGMDSICVSSRRYAKQKKLHYATVSAKNAQQTFKELLGTIGNFRPTKMKKRRQSMPAAQTGYIGIEPADLQRIAKKHAASNKNACSIS